MFTTLSTNVYVVAAANLFGLIAGAAMIVKAARFILAFVRNWVTISLRRAIAVARIKRYKTIALMSDDIVLYQTFVHGNLLHVLPFIASLIALTAPLFMPVTPGGYTSVIDKVLFGDVTWRNLLGLVLTCYIFYRLAKLTSMVFETGRYRHERVTDNKFARRHNMLTRKRATF